VKHDYLKTFGGWRKQNEAGPKDKTIVTMLVEFAR